MNKKQITVQLKRLSRSRETAFLSFMRNHMGDYKTFEQCWQWRKDSNVEYHQETIVAAYGEDQEILGCIGIVPADIRCNGNKIHASWQQDSLVSPLARGLGVGKKLVKKGQDDFRLVVAKGTSRAMYGLRKSLGYNDVPCSTYMLNVCGLPAGISIQKSVAFGILKLWGKVIPCPKKTEKMSIRSITHFGADMDDLAAVLSSENVIRPYKGKDYLNERYGACPGKKYTILGAYDQTTRGCIVLNISGQDKDEGWIVDMMCGSHDSSCAYALIRAALDFFNHHQVSRVWCFATFPPARRWFYRFGFVATNRSPRFTWFSDHTETKDMASQTAWDFWHGDGDIEFYQ